MCILVVLEFACNGLLFKIDAFYLRGNIVCNLVGLAFAVTNNYISLMHLICGGKTCVFFGLERALTNIYVSLMLFFAEELVCIFIGLGIALTNDYVYFCLLFTQVSYVFWLV